MKFTKIETGLYRAENGIEIRKKTFTNMFTGRTMSGAVWHIFKDNEKIDFANTLTEAKRIVETL